MTTLLLPLFRQRHTYHIQRIYSTLTSQPMRAAQSKFILAVARANQNRQRRDPLLSRRYVSVLSDRFLYKLQKLRDSRQSSRKDYEKQTAKQERVFKDRFQLNEFKMKIFVCLVLAMCIYGSQSGAVEMSKDESAELDSVEHGMCIFLHCICLILLWKFVTSLHKFPTYLVLYLCSLCCRLCCSMI